MPDRDLHKAPKSEIVASHQEGGIDVRLVQLQWSKDEIKHSLHVCPIGFTTSGIQLTDILNLLGFTKTECPFFGLGAYCDFVDDEFDIATFAKAFQRCADHLKQADQHLRSCALGLQSPEGWGHFFGKPSRPSSGQNSSRGDGHTANVHSLLRQGEDDSFLFRQTWIDGGADRGWTLHVRPKHPPLSPEVKAVFDLLQLRKFESCPEFDFEPCNWHFIAGSGRSSHEEILQQFQGAAFAENAFAALPTNFSKGISLLLDAHAALLPFGRRLLKVGPPASPGPPPTASASPPLSTRVKAIDLPDSFDVAISFAGAQRDLAELLATIARDAGLSVFYDDFYPEQLWGKDLPVFFDEIFRKRSRYCVIFVSKDYVEGQWTDHERKSAVARALSEPRKEYILPIKVDDSDLPGIAPTLGYLSLKKLPVESIAELLISKLRMP